MSGNNSGGSSARDPLLSQNGRVVDGGSIDIAPVGTTDSDGEGVSPTQLKSQEDNNQQMEEIHSTSSAASSSSRTTHRSHHTDDIKNSQQEQGEAEQDSMQSNNNNNNNNSPPSSLSSSVETGDTVSHHQIPFDDHGSVSGGKQERSMQTSRPSNVGDNAIDVSSSSTVPLLATTDVTTTVATSSSASLLSSSSSAQSNAQLPDGATPHPINDENHHKVLHTNSITTSTSLDQQSGDKDREKEKEGEPSNNESITTMESLLHR